MKFSCGKTRAQKRAEKIERLQNWHKWFAWRPVRVGNNDCRWLELVERRGELIYQGSISESWRWCYCPLRKFSVKVEIFEELYDVPEWVNWIAMDEDGEWYGYKNKPDKKEHVWSIHNHNDNVAFYITTSKGSSNWENSLWKVKI